LARRYCSNVRMVARHGSRSFRNRRWVLLTRSHWQGRWFASARDRSKQGLARPASPTIF